MWKSGGAITIGAPDRTGTRIACVSAVGSSAESDMSCWAPFGVPVVPDVITMTLLARSGMSGSGSVSPISASIVFEAPSAHATSRRPAKWDSSTIPVNSSSWTSNSMPSRSATWPSCAAEVGVEQNHVVP